MKFFQHVLCLMTLLAGISAVTGCDDESDNDQTALDGTTSAAVYEVTIWGQWGDSFAPLPSRPLFSDVAGAVVNSESVLWQPGQLASTGFEQLAEEGETAGFLNEINQEITANRASMSFVTELLPATGTVTFRVNVSRAFPEISFASMLDPTPDWVIGVECLSFLDENGLWMSSVDRELPVYDAGTEEGTDFSLDNPATNPVQPIALLNGTIGNGVVFVDGRVNGRAIASMSAKRIR
ncbi:Uncharacterised protein [BD1-7 clade bacterium]|uniref:Spondin domain-containing protein n=1 Tax=BD1-7 clade bacterium TaxID=2029982 RepID=A0A5S9Q5A1_9GAMM|nr:Uncharacterised protein [BD1-7 clade bacterium]CAA0112549.1 Uncharacterised protein [BD1-7 clade bacterium]